MTRVPEPARRLRSTNPVLALGGLVLALTALLLGLVVPGSASADRGRGYAVPPPPTSPVSADQIQNIDQVRTAIKAYYGDTTTTQVDPVDNDGKDVALHTFGADSAYVHELAGITAWADKYLTRRATSAKFTGTPAILFDVDDTTLNTYNYEIYSNFAYNPAQNAAFVNSGVFPAVPGMVALEKAAEAKGYTVFFLTGRPEAQRAGTVANLATVGYDVTSANLYLKDLTKPIYASCAPSCSTIQYKSLTRAYLESQGFDIVANFGDQYSDLKGGYADETVKIPNPMYYLP